MPGGIRGIGIASRGESELARQLGIEHFARAFRAAYR
jgi:hypothetical protein